MTAYLTPSTWAGSDLNTASWRAQFAPGQIEGSFEVETVLANVLDDFPALATISRKARRFALWLFWQEGSASARREEITRWFSPDSGCAYLVATDPSGASRRLLCQPLSIQPHPQHPRGFVVLLEANDPIWERTSTCQVSASITASGTTISVCPGGNIFAEPVIEITPQSAKSGCAANRYQLPFSVTNNLAWDLVNYPVEVTDGGWDTATLVAAGSMQSDGSDIRVLWKNQEVNHWLANMNASNTKVWAVLDLEGESTGSGQITFGDLSAASKAMDADLKPVFDLSQSDNANWIYANEWGSEGGTRPGAWQRSFDGTTIQSWRFDWGWIAQGGASSGSWQDVDPWREAGIRKRNDLWGQAAVLDNGYLINIPAGLSSMEFRLERRLYGSDHSQFQGRFKSSSAADARWSYFWEDEEDTSSGWTTLSGGWAPWTGCARIVQMRVTTPYLSGVDPTPDDWGFYLTAASLRLKNYPTVVTSSSAGAYSLSASITNTSLSPQQSISVCLVMGVGQTLKIDTQAHTVTNTTTGCWQNQALYIATPRRDWLPLSPSTENVLRYDEENVQDTTVVISWRDRWL